MAVLNWAGGERVLSVGKGDKMENQAAKQASGVDSSFQRATDAARKNMLSGRRADAKDEWSPEARKKAAEAKKNGSRPMLTPEFVNKHFAKSPAENKARKESHKETERELKKHGKTGWYGEDGK